jgi:hypothetical protein
MRCGGELAGQPLVDAAEYGVLAEVHVQGMLHAVGEGVLGREPAAVVRSAVDPVALHPPLAQAADHQAAERVGMLPAMRLLLSMSGGASMHQYLHLVEDVTVDERRVHDLV